MVSHGLINCSLSAFRLNELLGRLERAFSPESFGSSSKSSPTQAAAPSSSQNTRNRPTFGVIGEKPSKSLVASSSGRGVVGESRKSSASPGKGKFGDRSESVARTEKELMLGEANACILTLHWLLIGGQCQNVFCETFRHELEANRVVFERDGVAVFRFCLRVANGLPTPKESVHTPKKKLFGDRIDEEESLTKSVDKKLAQIERAIDNCEQIKNTLFLLFTNFDRILIHLVLFAAIKCLGKMVVTASTKLAAESIRFMQLTVTRNLLGKLLFFVWKQHNGDHVYSIDVALSQYLQMFGEIEAGYRTEIKRLEIKGTDFELAKIGLALDFPVSCFGDNNTQKSAGMKFLLKSIYLYIFYSQLLFFKLQLQHIHI